MPDLITTLQAADALRDRAQVRTTPSGPGTLVWRVWNEGGKLHVTASNKGNLHLKLTDFTVDGPSGSTKISATGSGAYVLTGSTLTYDSEPGAPTYPVGTQVTVNAAKGTPFAVRQQVAISTP
jgi:P pilus assembly chaperone PapD